jgi:2-C-methyl-D-erythritol 4-phosphate cytidylyltransferase
VFGGSYGIGRDIVRLAERAGSTVFSFSRSTTGTYVEQPDTVRQALAEVAEKTGRIDAVILSAAQLVKGPLTEMTAEQVLSQIDINYLGPVIVARASEPYLRESQGHLVLFTSSSYTRGRADYSLYSSTKAAVVNLAQGLADEWSEAGIHVNVVNPERTRTPMRARAFGDEPDHTLLDSVTVASTVLDLLASDMTGHVVDVRRDVTTATEAELVAAGLDDVAAEAGRPRTAEAL